MLGPKILNSQLTLYIYKIVTHLLYHITKYKQYLLRFIVLNVDVVFYKL